MFKREIKLNEQDIARVLDVLMPWVKENATKVLFDMVQNEVERRFLSSLANGNIKLFRRVTPNEFRSSTGRLKGNLVEFTSSPGCYYFITSDAMPLAVHGELMEKMFDARFLCDPEEAPNA